jgi:hypothetical protein
MLAEADLRTPHRDNGRLGDAALPTHGGNRRLESRPSGGHKPVVGGICEPPAENGRALDISLNTQSS